jgi:hypothetical protein
MSSCLAFVLLRIWAKFDTEMLQLTNLRLARPGSSLRIEVIAIETDSLIKISLRSSNTPFY